MRRFRLLLLLPLLVLDCLGNVLIGGSWRNTLSSEAWNHRGHRHWGWCWRAIDGLFFWQPWHCAVQADREERAGGVWRAFSAEWKRAKGPRQ